MIYKLVGDLSKIFSTLIFGDRFLYLKYIYICQKKKLNTDICVELNKFSVEFVIL